jgi:hypothetical protein
VTTEAAHPVRVSSTPTITDRALLIMLRERPNLGAMAASLIGAMLWPERSGRVVAVHGGGDYAAQMLLGRMKKAGLVRVISGAGSSRWELTGEGNEAAVRAARRWVGDNLFTLGRMRIGDRG